MQDLTRTSQALQAMVMQVRMIPVEAVFLRFPRLVRDLSVQARQAGRAARSSASETELDRTVVDALGDPLVHLVRNALDHGLESPEERVAAGKPATGALEISARHAGGNVVITVRDDGRGIDPERVARKAVERGLITAEQAAADRRRRARSSCSSPPASRPPTRRATSPAAASAWTPCAPRSASSAARSLLTSELGRGTTAQIRLPLTLAIVAALLVEVGGLPFAIPLDRVERTLRSPTTPSARRRPPDARPARRRAAAPRRRRALWTASRRRTPRHAVVVRGAAGPLALAVGPPRRPARAGHPPAAARGRRARGGLRRRRALGRPDRPDRRLRRHRRPDCLATRRLPSEGTREHYSDLQLDALRELANIGSGTAGTRAVDA